MPFGWEKHMKVLLPVDGSDYTKRRLSYIAAHDEFLGAGHDYTIFISVPFIPARVASIMSRSAIDDSGCQAPSLAQA